MSEAYCAPASKVLAVLHKPDPATPPAPGKPDEATTGQTKCGLPMLAVELWLPVDWRPGDTVCPGCDGRAQVQDTLL